MDDLLNTLEKQASLIKKVQNSIKTLQKPQETSSKQLVVFKTEIASLERSLVDLTIDTALKDQIRLIIDEAQKKRAELEGTARSTFGSEFERLLAPLGFKLEGNYPKLRAGWYTFVVDIDLNRVTLWYGPELEKLDTCPAIPGEVVKKLQKIHTMITQRDFDEGSFIKNIFSAYQLYLAKSKRPMEDLVPISEILGLYAYISQDQTFKNNPKKEYYREYNRVFFSYDLSRLRNRTIDTYELKLITATRAYTKRRYDNLWIPRQEGGGSHISQLRFMRSDNGS